MAAPSEGTIEADISRLENGIRQLKVQYDMFLAGALSREPSELRNDLERLIKRYANAPIRKYQHRFQFNALVARYNCLSELLGKTLRALEEGERPAPAVAERSDRRASDRVVAKCKLGGTPGDDRWLRQLHRRFQDARRRAGEGAEVPYDAFARKIVSQARQIREKSGCDRVELRVVVNDRKVLLKARPG